MANSQAVPLQSLSEYDWSLAHFGVLPYNPTVYCLIASLFAVALWLSIDLTAQVHLTFKSYRGLYYWSMLATTAGIAFHSIAFILKLFIPAENEIGSTFLAKLGWVMNVTGFSMVLYSRLGLVVQNRSVLRVALTAIIVDVVLLHTPIVVFSFGLSTRSYKMWLPYMAHMERIQIIGFTLQDLILSTIYTWTSAKLLNDKYSHRRRNLFIALLFAQIFGFCADMVMIVLDFDDKFTLKASLHPFIYAIKLKIEFLVLNQLSSLVRPNEDNLVMWGENGSGPLCARPKPKRLSSWSFKSTWSKTSEEKFAGVCLRCESLDKSRKSSEAALSEKSPVLPSACLASASRRQSASAAQDFGYLRLSKTWSDDTAPEDKGIEDLERQYLGKFGE